MVVAMLWFQLLFTGSLLLPPRVFAFEDTEFIAGAGPFETRLNLAGQLPAMPHHPGRWFMLAALGILALGAVDASAYDFSASQGHTLSLIHI